MKLEAVILSCIVPLSLLSLLFVPKTKRLEMQFVIFFVQLPTWLLGLSVVELGWIEYPYRELATVNRTSFIFEYVFLPILCVHVNNYYPRRAATVAQVLYLGGIALIMTGIEILLERHTMLIKYSGWQWYWTWASVTLVFWLTQKTVVWFFRRS